MTFNYILEKIIKSVTQSTKGLKGKSSKDTFDILFCYHL